MLKTSFFYIQACLPILTKDTTRDSFRFFIYILIIIIHLPTYYILQEIVYKLYNLKEFFNANFMNKSLVSLSSLRAMLIYD